MKLSTITATYNHAQYLPECLNSILNQERKADEIIIIDDASTDCTQEIIQRYQEKWDRIIYIKNEKNLGPAKSLNKALKIARGEYIAGCAADDFLLKHFFKKAMECLEQHPKIGLCCGDAYHFSDVKPYRFRFVKAMPLDALTVFDPAVVPEIYQKKDFVIPSHACMYRKDALLEHGGFCPELQSLCDWYLNIAIALTDGFAYIPSPFAAYRLTLGSYAVGVSRNRAVRESVLSFLFGLLAKNKHLQRSFLQRRIFSQLPYHYFGDFLRNPSWRRIAFACLPAKIRKMVRTQLKKIGAKEPECERVF